jgi:hypothetical protein
MIQIKKIRPKGLKVGDFVYHKKYKQIHIIYRLFKTPFDKKWAAHLCRALSKGEKKSGWLFSVSLIDDLKKIKSVKGLKEWWR